MGGGIVALFLSLIVCATPAYADETVDVYRLWQPLSQEHLYTTDWNEAENLNANTDWIYEGIAFRTPIEGAPVYRMFNNADGAHHLTIDEKERDYLTQNGWNNEGIIFLSSTAKDKIPIYRLYSAPYHLWTVDETEYNSLGELEGWSQEDIAFYAAAPGEPLPPGQMKQSPTAEDLYAREWAPRIDAYNAGWPLAGYGDTFARAAYRTGMDPRTAPAIARIESGSGKIPLYRYGAGNCWGWMAPLTNDFESSIYLYCEKFSKSYGSTLTPNGAARYAGHGGYYSVFIREVNKI